MGQSASTPTTVTGVNEIPPPQFDANANAPPQKQHDRVIDFVREAPTATYTFDSRANRDDPDTELCRVNANGTKSCIRMDLNSKALFKSMQSLSFYCALPAEPTRTHMECNRLPQMSSR